MGIWLNDWLLLSRNEFLPSCPSYLPHHERLFYAFRSITTIVNFEEFLEGYNTVLVLGGDLTFNNKVRSWCKLTVI